nr:ketoacyl-ACP synthase III [Actinomadura rubrisoli]
MLTVGSYRPEMLDSAEAAAKLGVTRDWIVSRTGVESLCVAGPEESVVAMAVAAARRTLSAARMPAHAVDAVLVATITNPQPCPAVAPQLAAALEIDAAAFDINIACAGFCSALQMARSLIAAGDCKTVLVIGAERMRDIVDTTDLATAPLFSDGAGAMLVTTTTGPSGIGPVVWGSEGGRASALQVQPPVFGSPQPESASPALRLDGGAVARWAFTTIPNVVREILTRTGLEWDDVAAFVPHQANWNMIRRIARLLEIPEKVVIADDIQEAGNTSSASIPLALHRLIGTGRARPGQWAVLIGFGAGLAYAGQAILIPEKPAPTSTSPTGPD